MRALGAGTFAQLETPTLRNVTRTSPYLHQGQLATLDDLLHLDSTHEGQMPSGPHEESLDPALLSPP